MTDASADYPSPFARYKLVRVEGYAERDPTDEEREAFNAQYPAAAFSRQADQPGGKVATPWVKAGRSGQRQTDRRAGGWWTRGEGKEKGAQRKMRRRRWC